MHPAHELTIYLKFEYDTNFHASCSPVVPNAVVALVRYVMEGCITMMPVLHFCIVSATWYKVVVSSSLCSNLTENTKFIYLRSSSGTEIARRLASWPANANECVCITATPLCECGIDSGWDWPAIRECFVKPGLLSRKADVVEATDSLHRGVSIDTHFQVAFALIYTFDGDLATANQAVNRLRKWKELL